MIRGDVFRAILEMPQGSEQAGTRPVVIVSRDAINRSSPVVIIVPLTSRSNKARLYPSHVEIKAGEAGLPLDSVALCEQVRAIAVSRLSTNLGHLPNQRIGQINAALKIALDLP
ncbi:MAG TPA: type II toxin-antitoxin system PemK/MazF family toxin [Verrucomicrobiae bacterium]|nr:type II toxin-antitoxin system PemK/MazF family toxin [Verrucomicrobiae bacterium]